jgi:pimeloyl-ACP methyl ester carboxylesterase
MQIFIIPGNPPSEYFYKIWKKELTDDLKLDQDSVAVEYFPSFCMSLSSEAYYQEMVNFYKERLFSFIENNKSEEVVLIGHSVGGTIALDILKEHPEKIDKCVLIFPFLGKPGKRGRLVLNFVRALVKSTKMIPFIIKRRAFIDIINSEFSKISDDEIESSLKFAFHERETIGKIKKVNKLEPSIIEKVTVLTCPKDTWCINKYLYQAGLKSKMNHLEVSHDFVVESKQRKIVNESLVNLL